MCRKQNYLISLALLLSLVLSSSVQADLVGWWRLDGGSGSTATDSSGNGNDGTLQGGAQWALGKNAGAVEFDGVDDFVEVPHAEILTVDTDVTVMAWIHTSRHGGPPGQGYQGIIAKSNDPRSYSLYTQSNGTLHFSTAGIGSDSGATVPLNEWVHVAAMVAGGEHRYYINGELTATSGSGIVLPGMADTATVVIGRTHEGTNRSFLGRVDDAKIYDTALTQEEIQIAMIGVGQPLAFGPVPEDGAMLEATWINLRWNAGDFAVSHDVYLGESFEDVEAGAESTFAGNQTAPNLIAGFVGFPFPDGLVPGTTYYWRIDEVNDANAASPWKGKVWSFWVPPKKAYDAVPTHGAGFVLADATVSWTNGFGGKLTQMYFGTDSAEVDAGTGGTAKGPVVTTTYDPGQLENGTTYYWRVDQFDGVETHKGDVWSFTTVADIAVADPDLQGWWTLDEGEGTTAVDWSGNGGHGSFVGEPQWVDGYQGSALEFDGGEFVNCGDNAATGVTADFTLAAWVKLNPGNAGQYLGIGGKLSRLGGNADYMGYALVRHSSNVFRLWVGDGDAANIIGQAGSDVTYTDTDWHHVAGVREGQLNMLYVDGVRQAAGNATSFVPSDLFFQIGRQYSNTTTQRQFNGKIDDVRVYNRALTDAQIAEVMLGDTKMAGSPVPGRDALLDIRNISSLSWSKGGTASSHDVYLGTDRDAVAGADNAAPEFQGSQAGTSLSLGGLVEFGGGDYYWRIDEVEAGGAVNAGTIWKFTVPGHLIVDNFESYNNIDPPNVGSNRVFDNWIDGFGTTTNGALVGNDVPPYGEHGIVQSGNQALVYSYDNAGKTSEATLTLVKRDWTVEGVAKLSLWFRGASANAADRVYVALNGTAVVYHDDPAATQLSKWNEWVIDLAAFGVDLPNVSSISIGVGTKNAPSPSGGAGTMYFDDIRLVR